MEGRESKRVKFTEDLGKDKDALLAARASSSSAAAEYSCSANDCMTIHLIHCAEELKEEQGGLAFSPSMTHQLFENEKIYGYKGLKIKLWLHAATLHAYLEISYSNKITTGRRKKADEIPALFKEKLDAEFFESKEEFLQSLSSNEDTRLKDLSTESLSTSAIKDSEKSIEIVKVPLDNELSRAWHSRLETLSFFFVDGVSRLELPDPHWELLVLLERPADWDGKAASVTVVGFATIYSFYAHPDSTRLRLSQILILPPFQRKGYGRSLLQSVYKLADERNCLDVTIEDPTDELQALRDAVDVERLEVLPEIKAALESVFLSEDKAISMPMSALEVARKKLKINKKQALRCWEVLLSMRIAQAKPELQDAFMQLVIQRLEADSFGKTEDRPTAGKRLVETADGFVMMRCSADADVSKAPAGPQEEVEEEEDGGVAVQKQTPEEKAQEKQEKLQELYNLREEEIRQVVQKVRASRNQH